MRDSRKIVVGAIFAALCLLVVLVLSNDSAEPKRTEASKASRLSEEGHKNDARLNSNLPTHPEPADSVARIEINDREADEFVREILADPSLVKRPSEIPKLSDDHVRRLNVAYLKIDLPTDKKGILWSLAFSQNDRAFDTLRYALEEEYRDRELSRRDNALLLHTVLKIGVLSKHSDQAWNHLKLMTDENYWNRFEPWSEDYLTEQYQSEESSKAQVLSDLQTSAFSALGVGGRQEFISWADDLLSGKAGTNDFIGKNSSAIRFAVFQAEFIKEFGIERFYDEVFFDLRGGTSAFTRWARTPEGMKWGKWRDAQFEALQGAATDAPTRP